MKFKEVPVITGESIDRIWKACCSNIIGSDADTIYFEEDRKVYALDDFVGYLVINFELYEIEFLFVMPEYQLKVDWMHTLSLIPNGEWHVDCSEMQRRSLKRWETRGFIEITYESIRSSIDFPYIMRFKKCTD